MTVTATGGPDRKVFKIVDTSPGTASTTALGGVIEGLIDYDWFTIDAIIIGGTGGTLDVVLHRQVESNVWAEWLHFPQVAAGVTKTYSVQTGSDNIIREVGVGATDAAAGTQVLPVNSFIGGHPGLAVRAVYITGSGVSVGATETIRLTAWKRKK